MAKLGDLKYLIDVYNELEEHAEKRISMASFLGSTKRATNERDLDFLIELVIFKIERKVGEA